MSLGIDWDFNNLECLIEDRGDYVIHETGLACPQCRVEDPYASMAEIDGNPGTYNNGAIGCQMCFGVGWIFRNPTQIRGLVTSIQSGQNRTLIEMGYAVPGDCVFSPSLRIGQLSDFDKITFGHAPVPLGDGSTIVRGSATTGINQVLDTGLLASQDRVWYNIASVTHCEDSQGVVYRQGADFTVDGKVITWVGNAPPRGRTYSFKYFGYLEWLVYATPMARFDNARNLGQKVLLRKVHAAFLNAHRGDSVQKREEERTGYAASFEL